MRRLPTRALRCLLVGGTAAVAMSAPAAQAHGPFDALGVPGGAASQIVGTSVPGVAATAPSPQALAATLHQATGLTPAQVTAQDVCPPAAPGVARCEAQALRLRSDARLVRPHVGQRASFTQVFPSARAGIAPAYSPGAAAPQADTPAWLQQAYDLSYLSQTAGSSDTVAIVDAYDDPNAASDLGVFRSAYGLPACTTANGCFQKVNESGQTSPLPAGNLGWEGEESLDMDAVSSLCPNCHIILVEASGADLSDLDAAVAQADAMGANQISNSWSATSSGPIGGTFTFPGVAVLAATGDYGYVGPGYDNYPAAYPGVTAAGGTSLAASSEGQSARGFSEGGWSTDSNGVGGGSGCDLAEPKPAYQTDTGCTGRAYADVSADADPSTGLIVYDSGNGGWMLLGGTSLATPLTAAFEAVTGVAGASPSWAYADSSLLNDPTTGSNGSCAADILYICNAGVGYDGLTGVGSISGSIAQGGPGIGGPSIGSGADDTYVTSLAATSANLAGGVYPNGLDTTYYWQYGTTNAYGQQTASADAGAGHTPVGFTGALSGLTPSTTYHYRLVASNSAGTSYGYDFSLTTYPANAAPPVDTAAPTLSGLAQQGQILTASTGTWNPTPSSYAYQWQRSTDGGNTWTNIAGQTGATYLLAGTDVGALVRAAVIATDAYGNSTADSAPDGPIASGAPFDTSPPTISGSPQQGQALNVSATWNPAGSVYSYQWQHSANGTTWSNIGGATSSSYVLAPSDEGLTVRAVVTAVNAYGQLTADSAAVGPVAANPPVNTSAPALTGTPQRTYALSVTPGSWNGSGNTYAYQWQRSTDGGNTWSSISGAINTTYTLGDADEGASVRVLVTASNLDGIATQASNATQVIAPYPPANTVPPAVSGTPERTFTLTAAPGTWTGPGLSYAYQWQEDAGDGYQNIAGATNATYLLAASDENTTVRVVVTASNDDGTISEASPPTANVQNAVPVNTSVPTISGTAQRTDTLTAGIGTWGGLGNTYAYQWQRSPDGNTWTSVSGATGATYTLGVADEGSEVRVLVTATNPDGSAGAASAATSTVPSSPPTNSSPPTLSGSVQRGSTLTGAQGTWGGLGDSYAYQWQHSSDGGNTWTSIGGATATTYTIGVGDEGTALRLLVTASNADGSLGVATAATGVIQSAPPINSALPTVSGTAQRGDTLSSTAGTWSGLGNAYAYQWQRSTDDGNTWSAIAGATSTTYTLAVADEGSVVRVLVTASNPDGSASAASAATWTVASAAPANTVAPSISGTAVRTDTFIGALGTWGGIGNVYAYQWQRSADGGNTWTSISGATGTSYTLTVADEGSLVRLLVTATNPDGTVAAASAASATVQGSVPVNTAVPTISGIVQRASALSASLGTWGGLGNGYTYQWQRSADGGNTWTSISGATSSGYTVALADENSELRVLVTATNPDGSASAASAATMTIPSAPPVDTVAPSVSGPAQRSYTLTAAQGTWSGIGNAYSLQWQHDSGSGFTNIANATGSTYTLGVADEGSTIRLLVTVTNPDGTASAASAATATVQAAAPANTAVPTVSGTAERAATLTSTTGTWSGIGNTYAYQWQSSPDGGTTWSNIAGAVGITYTPAVTDEGSEIRLLVTATNPDGSVSAASAATGGVQSAAPSNSVAPTVSGTAQRTFTLTSTIGTWGGLGNTYGYQWQRSANGTSWANVAGATAATYTLGVADEGSEVRLLVTATNPDASVSAASAPTAAVLSAPASNAAVPTVSGTAQRTFTLSAAPGTWNGLGNTYSDQWQSSSDGGNTWSNLSGATGSTYTLGSGDEGTQLRVLVTATNADGTATAASVATGAVSSDPPVNTGAPSFSGTLQRTFVLTANAGTWGGPDNAYAYQWQRATPPSGSWTSIAGATGATYTLAQADETDIVRVLVTATNPDGSVVAASAPSAAVQGAPPVNTAVPSVAGTTRVGATLSAANGSWSPAASSFSYVWQRGSGGGGYQPIAGATSATYVLQQADLGETVRVVVTGTNVDGSASATSAATATVMAPPQNTVAPAAPTGTLMDTYTLTPNNGTWDTPSATFSYTWLRCPASAASISSSCVQVGSGSTYTLAAADVGSPIGVVVTASSTGGQSSADSALTAVVTGRPLTNSVAPSISGDPQVPNTLSAGPGQWSVPITGITYNWERCDANGTTNCVQVTTNAAQYTLSAADANHAIVLIANATSPGRTASAQSPPLVIQAQPLPQNEVAPAIAGTTTRTYTLSATTGEWSNSPTSFTYQWQRCNASGANCQSVAGATGTSYLLSKADEGSEMVVVVTATNGAGSGVASSKPTAVVAGLPPVTTHAPVIGGSPIQQGVALSESAVSWQTTSDTTYATAWERCDVNGANCQAISGATANEYVPTASDVGHTLVVVVTATNPDGSVPSASAATSTVLPVPPRWKNLPVLSTDSGQVGDLLSILAGVWTGPPVSTDTTQMMRCTNACVADGAANATSYTIASGDVGAILRVRETASNLGGSTIVWSARYVGPVMSAASGAAVLASGRVALRNPQGATLALARLVAGPAVAQASRVVFAPAAMGRVLHLRRAPSVRGRLVAWACSLAIGPSGPPACTAKVVLHQAVATVRLPLSMQGKVRIVVVRRGH